MYVYIYMCEINYLLTYLLTYRTCTLFLVRAFGLTYAMNRCHESPVGLFSNFSSMY